MLICNDCEKTFEEPICIQTSYEKYFGVGDQFGNHHSLEIYCCPFCRSEDFEEYEEEQEE